MQILSIKIYAFKEVNLWHTLQSGLPRLSVNACCLLPLPADSLPIDYMSNMLQNLKPGTWSPSSLCACNIAQPNVRELGHPGLHLTPPV